VERLELSCSTAKGSVLPSAHPATVRTAINSILFIPIIVGTLALSLKMNLRSGR
jgi:hypothetical protein